MKKLLCLVLPLFCLCCRLYAEEDVYQKLFDELAKYPVVYNTYSETNFPVMSGNGSIGGLLDPLGRGVCNIEMNDLFLDASSRIVGAGMMLKFARFAGLKPDKYNQHYDLRSGILTTEVEYQAGAYRSEMFFSADKQDYFVYMIENTGENDLVCNIDFGRYEMRIDSFSENTVSFVSPENSFTTLHYDFYSNINFGKTNFPNSSYLPWSKDIFLKIPAGKRLEIVAQLRVSDKDNNSHVAEYSALRSEHIAAWERNWRRLGFVLLPESDFAKTYYRSLHYLQCAAGAAGNLPGECQFGAFSTYIANEYNLRVNQNLSNITPWQQRPFTYGGAGWATLAYIVHGDFDRAGAMLSAFYRPDALKDNAKTMFPSEKSAENADAICFAHETLADGRNHPVPPWDKQVHIQGFAPAMFALFNKLSGQKTDTVYAVVKGSAEFWRTILKYDAKTKTFTVPPLLSVTEDLFEEGNIDALIAARWTLSEAASMAEKLGVDRDLRKIWKDISNRIHIADHDGVYLEFAGDDGSRAGAGYMGIRGYVYLGFPTVEIMKSLSRAKVNKSLDLCWARNRRGEGMITFIADWFALTDAYWGRAEAAYEKALYAASQTEPHTSSMCEQNGSLYYFLTGYASFTMIPVAMVLQTTGEETRVFPAVPQALKDIEFYNLPTAGGRKASGVMKGGKIRW